MTVYYMLNTWQECDGCVAQSVARRTTDWEVSGSIPGGIETFFFLLLSRENLFLLFRKTTTKKKQYDVTRSFSWFFTIQSSDQPMSFDDSDQETVLYTPVLPPAPAKRRRRAQPVQQRRQQQQLQVITTLTQKKEWLRVCFHYKKDIRMHYSNNMLLMSTINRVERQSTYRSALPFRSSLSLLTYNCSLLLHVHRKQRVTGSQYT